MKMVKGKFVESNHVKNVTLCFVYIKGTHNGFHLDITDASACVQQNRKTFLFHYSNLSWNYYLTERQQIAF